MMKNLLTAFALSLAAMTATAQTSTNFGIRASFDVTHATGTDDGLNNGSGVTIMGVYTIPLTSKVYFEPGVGVYYNTMGIQPVEFDDGLYDGSIRNFGFKVPFNVGYRVELFNNLDIAAYTGPWVNVNMTAKASLQPNFEGPAPTRSTSLFDDGWHRVDAQWGFGISATYAQKYYIGISGGIGMTAMATFDGHDGAKHRLRRNTVSISLGYNF